MIKKITIDNVGIHGEGIAHHEGFTIFVDNALPGEVVEVELFQVKKSYGRAKLISMIEPSPNRRIPTCPYFEQCGGCHLMHLDYPEQLAIKRQRVIDAFQRIGKLNNVHVNDCHPSPIQYHYRNKIQLPVRYANGKATFGLYERRTHNLIETTQCLIHSQLGEKVVEVVKEEVRFPLRHLLIKTAVMTNQVLVVFVATKFHPKLQRSAQIIMERCPEVRGVVLNINNRPDNVILSNKYRLLCGEDFIHEKLGDLTFKVSPASFFQVNPAQAIYLYNYATELVDLSDKVVLDAYCGVGTISLFMARQAKRAIGVECVPEAIEDAKYNAKLNNISNVNFVCADASSYSVDEADITILNPPRKGCASEVLHKITSPQIIYISCDPATLARDAAILSSRGYKIESVQPFDMFPQTAHVETVVLLKV